MKKSLYIALSFLMYSQLSIATELSQQRNLYAEAVQLQDQKSWQEANEKINLIPQYPLAYLIHYEYLKAHFDSVGTQAIINFVNENKQYSASDDLQRAYLYHLANHQKWDEYLAFYPKFPRSTDLRCFYIKAQISQKTSDEAWNKMRKVWLTGHSLPNACDSVIAHYIDNSKINQQLIWQRFNLAFKANNTSLMTHLNAFLRGNKAALASDIVQVNENLSSLLTTDVFTKKIDKTSPFLVTFIKRLSRKNLDDGLKAYYLYDQKLGFTKNEQITLKRYFAGRIIQNDKTNYFYWLDSFLADLDSDNLVEQRIRYAIRFNNWKDIEHWTQQLSPKLQKHPRWRYWYARGLEQENQKAAAYKIYTELAKRRSYYGFLSAQKVGSDYQFDADLITQKKGSLTGLMPELANIEELKFQGEHDRLKREWESFLKHNNKTTQQQLGLYAFNKGWSHLSVLASIRSRSWSALNIRFPEAAPSIFKEKAGKYSLDRTYIYAIARQESSFDEAAGSPVGAKGYMQLMPYTAKHTAKEIGLETYTEVSQLNNGEINVELGSAYFDMMVKRYKGNRILATAAYNAGPHRVDRWKQDKKGRDSEALAMDSWIETIPYKETRGYVKNVLAYNVIYQHILNKPLEFFNSTELKARY